MIINYIFYIISARFWWCPGWTCCRSRFRICMEIGLRPFQPDQIMDLQNSLRCCGYPSGLNLGHGLCSLDCCSCMDFVACSSTSWSHFGCCQKGKNYNWIDFLQNIATWLFNLTDTYTYFRNTFFVKSQHS